MSRTTRAVGTHPDARKKTFPPSSERDLPPRLCICKMAASGARPTGRLDRFLHILTKEARVEEELAMWIANDPAGPKLDSVGEFAQWYTEDTLKASLVSDIFDAHDPKIDPTKHEGKRQLIRLSMAWDLCSADWKKYVTTSAEPVVEEKEPDDDAS